MSLIVDFRFYCWDETLTPAFDADARACLHFCGRVRTNQIPQRVVNAVVRACAATRNERNTGREEIEELLVELESGLVPVMHDETASTSTLQSSAPTLRSSKRSEPRRDDSPDKTTMERRQAGRRRRDRGLQRIGAWKVKTGMSSDGIVYEGPGSFNGRSVLAAAAKTGGGLATESVALSHAAAARARTERRTERGRRGSVWDDTLSSLLSTNDHTQEARPSKDCWSHEIRTTRLSIPDISDEEDEEEEVDSDMFAEDNFERRNVFEDAALTAEDLRASDEFC